MADKKEPKIFKLNRLKFSELYNDALDYIKSTYKAAGQTFNTASPFGQLLLVMLHLGRMIFYYIEDSISGLNIRTAYRPDQIKGLAMLAGHDAARPIAARGAIKISYYDTGDPRLTGNICYFPNKTQIINKINGFVYTILLGADNGKITMQAGNYIEANVIQGVIKMQAATGTGEPLLSFNFAERNYATVDLYYLNVYVNGEPWEIVSSLFDLGYQQKGVLVRTGINSGIDIFFGNGTMGAIPPVGASIVVEYCVCDGNIGNVTKEFINGDLYWEIEGDGMLTDGSNIKLDNIFRITCLSDIIFGTNAEDSELTQVLAPHVSRSFVLANEVNYKYFFRRMNMFSAVEIIRGSYSVNGKSVMLLAKDQALLNYDNALAQYNDIVLRYGTSSNEAKQSYDNLQLLGQVLKYAESKLTDNTYQDNTVYIFLVPDITKRISGSLNYFTCDESLFFLSKDEQENILNLINASGQRIITVENRIIQPKTVRFAINVEAKIWDNYEKEDVYASALEELSKYFLNMTRKDMIPLSDIVSLFENNVQGIDSVKVSFDADVNNQDVYGIDGFYGIDDYGDIILKRTITDANGQYMEVKDILPLVRGGFVSPTGVEYSNIQSMESMSAFNLTIAKEKSNNDKLNLSKYTALT